MKQSSKIVLGLGIVASLLTVSQVSSAAVRLATGYSWQDSSGGQFIRFGASDNPACAKATPKTVVFIYTKNSSGKKMKLVKSNVFKEITQESRRPGKTAYEFTYTDILIPLLSTTSKLWLDGAVKTTGEDKMTNSGFWRTTLGATPCSGPFEIMPEGLAR